MYDPEKEMWETSRISRALGILKAAELLMEVVNGRIKTDVPG